VIAQEDVPADTVTVAVSGVADPPAPVPEILYVLVIDGDTVVDPDVPYTLPGVGEIVSEVQLPFVVQESAAVFPAVIVDGFAMKLVIAHAVEVLAPLTVIVVFFELVDPFVPYPVITYVVVTVGETFTLPVVPDTGP
jgi:hypothetical protein